MAKPAPNPKVPPAAPRKENRLIRYLKEVRAEVRRVTWPSRRVARNLTIIVISVTAATSVAMGVIDWVFQRLIALVIGLA